MVGAPEQDALSDRSCRRASWPALRNGCSIAVRHEVAVGIVPRPGPDAGRSAAPPESGSRVRVGREVVTLAPCRYCRVPLQRVLPLPKMSYATHAGGDVVIAVHRRSAEVAAGRSESGSRPAPRTTPGVSNAPRPAASAFIVHWSCLRTNPGVLTFIDPWARVLVMVRFRVQLPNLYCDSASGPAPRFRSSGARIQLTLCSRSRRMPTRPCCHPGLFRTVLRTVRHRLGEVVHPPPDRCLTLTHDQIAPWFGCRLAAGPLVRVGTEAGLQQDPVGQRVVQRPVCTPRMHSPCHRFGAVCQRGDR